MNGIRTRAGWLLLLAPLSLVLGADTVAPAVNWVLPIFTDKEGYRSLIARGSEVRQGGIGVISVTDLSLTIFSGDAEARVETVFLSPSANFRTKDNRAHGDKTVRILRDDLEATGTRWNYDHTRKHVTLDGNVRIVFNAGMKDLLK